MNKRIATRVRLRRNKDEGRRNNSSFHLTFAAVTYVHVCCSARYRMERKKKAEMLGLSVEPGDVEEFQLFGSKAT